jgi:hypothetical protein
MKERNISLSQREVFTISAFTGFLWWLSAAEKEILADCVTDRNRYRIIGMTVLCTWIFASLTWSYFFYTAIRLPIPAIALGLFLGFIILCIDRALIKGITKSNKRKMAPLLVRTILALSIGTFMAQPAVLYLFSKEIQLQISLDNGTKKMHKRQELDRLFSSEKATLLAVKNQAKKELSEKYAVVENARQYYLSEADGSGGSGKIGIKGIALAKKNEYEKLDKEFQSLLAKNGTVIDRSETALNEIEQSIKQEEHDFSTLLNDGFLTRSEALNNLLKKNSALQNRYYLILFILVLIELMPVIAKTLLPTGSYEEKWKIREEMETTIARANIRRETALKDFYNQLAFDNDRDLLETFFREAGVQQRERIKTYCQNWKGQEKVDFDQLWGKIKNGILSKQEH